MKHILFIMPDLPSGGAEKLLIDILKEMDYSQYRVSLLLEFRQGVYLNDIPKNIEIIAIHGKNNIWRERLFRGLRILHCFGLFHSIVYRLAVLFKLRGKKYDTIVSFMEGSAVKFHSYITHKAPRNVSWVHIDFKRKHWSLDFFQNKTQELNAYQKMDKIIFVSEEAKKGFRSIYNLAEEKCQVQYNLINKNDIQKQAEQIKVSKERFTICMVGRLNEQKRYDRAIEAVNLLKKKGYCFDLWILGEGHQENSLKEKCRELSVENQIKFLGFKKPSYAYMKVADIFLNTSDAEGYPLTICEAICLGKAIVATKIAGNSEILDDSKYGILVEEEVETIANGIERLLLDKSLISHYEGKAIERSNTFSVENTMQNIYKIISHE